MALACGVRMRLTATLNSLIIAGVIWCTSTPRTVDRAFCRLPRWSMAVAAMTPRSLASAFMRFILPADRFTGDIMARALQPHGFVIARHLQIARTARSPAVGHGAFPIAGARRVLRHQLLVFQGGGALQREVQRGYGDAPADGVVSAGLGTGPVVERLELEIRVFEVRGAPIGSDVGARRIGVGRAVGVAQLEQHQFRAGIQLGAEPIPALLSGFQLVGEPFVVHPGRSRDLDAVQGAGYIEAREGDVVRCLARDGGLLADAVLSVNHRRRARNEAQREANLFGHRGERLSAGGRVPLRLPIAVPDARLGGARAGDSGTRTVEALVVAEALPVDIGQREVSQIQVVDAPDGGVGGVSLGIALAEEDQFEAVTVPVPGVDIARVIQPFGAEIGVFEVVARKLVHVAGERLPVLRRSGQEEEQQNLHGSDSGGHGSGRVPAIILAYGPALLSWRHSKNDR